MTQWETRPLDSAEEANGKLITQKQRPKIWESEPQVRRMPKAQRSAEIAALYTSCGAIG